MIALTLMGAYRYWTKQEKWDLADLLKLLHDYWTGALLLAGFLFFATIRETSRAP